MKLKERNRIARIQTNHTKIKKLDLSYGELPDGWEFQRVQGVDPMKIPWKLDDESVEEAKCAYIMNRIPGPMRMAWMSELWRVLVPGGKCLFITPYWASPRAIQEPGSEWPPVCEQSYLYFNKNFRQVNKHPEPPSPCDFDYTGGYQLDPETQNKETSVQSFWVKHYINAVNDLLMTLTKKEKT